MKKITTLILGLLLCAFIIPASAQMNWGLRGGVNVSKLNLKDFKSQAATGWFLGPTTEFTIPILGLGFDASVLYSRVSTDIQDKTVNFNYLSIPLNLKYTILLPIVKPYIFGGPEFNVRMGNSHNKHLEHISSGSKGSDWSANVGGGVDLFSRLQVYVAYNFGFTNVLEDVRSKQSIWKMGAVVFF